MINQHLSKLIKNNVYLDLDESSDVEYPSLNDDGRDVEVPADEPPHEIVQQEWEAALE
ncbi:hypothetical protein [Eubacterium aggregans]|uniref:hypothetical protein n=1 Tax=Eubacterium aggregans TaxID=81409 RepID=UPI003F3B738D